MKDFNYYSMEYDDDVFIMGERFRVRAPRLTISAVLKGRRLNFGLAVCDMSDNFSKKVGREIAIMNALDPEKRVASIEVIDPDYIYDEFMAYAKRLNHIWVKENYKKFIITPLDKTLNLE